jgi:hypothetical protein
MLQSHQAQRAAGVQKLQNLFTMSQMGAPMPPNAFKKFVGQAGLKDMISTDPEQLAQYFRASQAQANQTGGQPNVFGQQTSMPRNPFQQNPDGTITPGQNAPQHVQDAINVHNALAQGQAPNPSHVRGMFVGAIAHAALNALKASFMPDMQKIQNMQMIERMQGNILAHPDSPQAQKDLGTLQRLGMVPFNLQAEIYANMNEQQRQGMYNIMAGRMSEADYARRSDGIAAGVMDRFQNPADAYAYADAVAHGRTPDPALTARMKPYSFTELAQNVQLGTFFSQFGVTPGEMSKAFGAALATGNPFAGLPPDAVSYAQKEYQLNLQKMTLEQITAQRQLEVAGKQLELAEVEAQTKGEAAPFEYLKQLAEIKKLGLPVSEEEIQGVMERIAHVSGQDLSIARNWWNYLWLPFFGHPFGKYDYTYTPAGAGTSGQTVDQMSGKRVEVAPGQSVQYGPRGTEPIPGLGTPGLGGPTTEKKTLPGPPPVPQVSGQ